MKLHLVALVSLALASACKPESKPGSGAGTGTGGGGGAGGGAAAAAPATAGTLGRLPADHVVAEWNGKKMTYGELMKKKEAAFKKLNDKYLTDLHQAEMREVEATVIEEIITTAAKAAGKSEEDYLRSLAGPDPVVTDSDINAFYEAQVKNTGQPLEQVKDRIRGFLVGNKQREAVKAAIDKMKADAKFTMTIPPPETSKVKFDYSNHPSKGPANAKITLAEFSDFQCPYCSRALPQLDSAMKAYPNDVRVVFFHFPLNFHEHAMPSAIAAQCAHLQGKFWEMHDKMFANQGALGAASYTAWAKEIGLDEAKFAACQNDPATKAFVDKDMEIGTAAGVEGTPSFFINGAISPSGPPTPDQIKPLL